MNLSEHQKKYLRGLGHRLKPLLMIGDAGLSESLLAEYESTLSHHELIKVKLRSDRDARSAWTDQIANQCGAERVHSIGQVSCFYRRNADEPVITLPDA